MQQHSSGYLPEGLQGFVPKLLKLRSPKLKTDQMDFSTHAGSSDGDCAIQAYMSINYILTKHGDRITNMTAGVVGVPEAWARFHFEKKVVHVYTHINSQRPDLSLPT